MLRIHIANISKKLCSAGKYTALRSTARVSVRLFCSDGFKGANVKIPDNFYDEELEAEKEFLDIKSAMDVGGLQKLTSAKPFEMEDITEGEDLSFEKCVEVAVLRVNSEFGGVDNLKWMALRKELKNIQTSIHASASSQSCIVAISLIDSILPKMNSEQSTFWGKVREIFQKNASTSDDVIKQVETILERMRNPSISIKELAACERALAALDTKMVDDEASSSDSDDEQELSHVEESDSDSDTELLREAGCDVSNLEEEDYDEDDNLGDLVNPNDLVRRDEDMDPALRNFSLPAEERSFDPLAQGSRPCPGKMQRRGIKPVLLCHKIDLDKISYLDVVRLRDFMSADGEILSKKDTGLCSKCQRVVAKTIKHTRNLGLLPHLGEFSVTDSRSSYSPKQDFHDPFPRNTPTANSKTVL